MAANIEFNTEKNTYSFVENGRKERAWHGLGQVYDRPLTVTEAIKGCNANYNVDLQPIAGLSTDVMTMIENGQDIPADVLKNLIIEGKRATMRNDNKRSLGVVSDSYGVVQNQEAFDFINVFCSGEKEEAPVIESAGVLGNGETTFITAKFPEPIIMAGDKNDPIDMYVVFKNSFDGTGAVNVLVTPIRVVCNNTLNLALRENSGKLSLRHTRHVSSRLDIVNNEENAKMAYRALNLYNTYKTVFEQKLNALKEIKVTDEQAEKLIAKSIMTPENFKIFEKVNFNLQSDEISTRAKNQIDSIKNSLFSGIGQENLEKGTGLWLINGLTTFYQNDMNWKDDEKKFNAITDGSVQTKLQTMYEGLYSLAA